MCEEALTNKAEVLFASMRMMTVSCLRLCVRRPLPVRNLPAHLNFIASSHMSEYVRRSLTNRVNL